MIKIRNYKWALLGFSSLCLAGVANANANANADDDVVVFEYQPESYSNIVAGGGTRTVSYVIQNLDDNPAPVYDLNIIPNMDDDFQDVDGLFVILDTITTPAVPGALACGSLPFTLPPADSVSPAPFCQIDVKIVPSAIEVEADEIPTGLVDREFVVSLSTTQRDLVADIDFNVTIGGSTDSFALLGNNICNEYGVGDYPVCTFNSTSVQTLDGMLQVNQDVAALACTSSEQSTPSTSCV
ncbi:MAG: hypothetical protein ABSF18_02070, partial [Gammaproteobacteria bacterium]